MKALSEEGAFCYGQQGPELNSVLSHYDKITG